MWHPAAGGTVTYGTANDLNQYPTVGGNSQTYNNNGCLTDDGTWTFGYDTLNRLISATDGVTSVSYLYDPMGRQLQKNVGGTKTNYLYAGMQRIADYDSSGTLLQRYVYSTGLDEPLIKITSGGTKTYIHHDRMGNVIAITDNTGAVTNRYKYSPWGESPSMSGTTFGFQGQRYDAETGLYYMKARYYDPRTGRFLQPDPIGYGDGLNLYQFAYNNPNNFTDPMGLAADGSVLGADTSNPASTPGNPPGSEGNSNQQISNFGGTGGWVVEQVRHSIGGSTPAYSAASKITFQNYIDLLFSVGLHGSVYRALLAAGSTYRHDNFAVPLVLNYLQLNGDIKYNLGPVQFFTPGGNPIADFVYWNGSQWRAVEVKTTIAGKEDPNPKFTEAQTLGYPFVKSGAYTVELRGKNSVDPAIAALHNFPINGGVGIPVDIYTINIGEGQNIIELGAEISKIVKRIIRID